MRSDDYYDEHPLRNQEQDAQVAPSFIATGSETTESEVNFPHRTLLETAEDCLAHSLLVFLYADLRLLSATGRINTKFEWICTNSDAAPKLTSSEIAGDKLLGEKRPDADSRGISPAQIMAVLIVELRKEVLTHRESKGTPEEEEECGLFSDKITDSIGRKKNEDNMATLLQAYNEMIGNDLNAELPKVQVNAFASPFRSKSLAWDFSKFKPFGNGEQENLEWVASSPGGGKKKPNPFKSRAQQNASKSKTFIAEEQLEESSTLPQEPKATNPKRQRESMPLLKMNSIYNLAVDRVNILTATQEETDRQKAAEVGDVLFGFILNELKRSPTNITASLLDRTLTGDELLDVMQAAVEKRVYGGKNIIEGFFKEGSVSNLLAKNKSKIVWINDWYPLKECTYAIVVDEEKKIAMLVFRGAITLSDWTHAYDWEMTKIPNPVKSDFKDRSEMIKVHKGFYEYLFRRRKDTGTCKYDEISNKLYEYAKGLGNQYRIVVTGHSLGGALSTIFAFFASTDDRFTKNGPIKMISFGSPYVGGYSFADAFRYQEEDRKLQYVRFHNAYDVVAHLPPNFHTSKRGLVFHHVGMSIELPSVPCKLSCKHVHPKLTYVKKEGFWKSYCRGVRNNFLLNYNWPWKINNTHTLYEHQKRIMYIRSIHSLLKEKQDEHLWLDMPIDEIYDKFVLT